MGDKIKLSEEEKTFCQAIKEVVDVKVHDRMELQKKEVHDKHHPKKSKKEIEKECCEQTFDETQGALAMLLETFIRFYQVLKQDNPKLFETITEELAATSELLKDNMSFHELIELANKHPVDEQAKHQVFLIAKRHFKEAEYEKAFLYFSWLCSSDATNPEMWFLRGLTEEHLKQYEEALASYHQAIATDPSYTKVYPQFMKCLIAMGKTPIAKKVYHEFLKTVDPKLYAKDHVFCKELAELKKRLK